LEFQRAEAEAELSESDARERGIRGGDEIMLRSNGTSVTLRARLSRELRPGIVRVPEDFAGELQPNVEVSR
jgi:anaerobic selenocysteine-containing dehydrogenase